MYGLTFSVYTFVCCQLPVYLVYISVLIALFGFTTITVRSVTCLLDLNMPVMRQFFEIHLTVFSVFFEYFPGDYGVGTVTQASILIGCVSVLLLILVKLKLQFLFNTFFKVLIH